MNQHIEENLGELEVALASARVSLQDINSIGRDCAELWSRLSSDDITLDDLLERKISPTNSSTSFAFKVARKNLRINEPELERLIQIARVAGTMHRVSRESPLEWREYSNGIANDLDVFQELVALGGEAQEVLATGKTVLAYYVEVGERLFLEPRKSSIGKAPVATTGVEPFVGCYATVSTSKRSTTGWVQPGRGKVLRIREDPFARSCPVQGSKWGTALVSAMEHPTVASLLWQQRQRPPHEWKEEKYDLNTASIQVILPPDPADERLDFVSRWRQDYQVILTTAKVQIQPYQEWLGKGGRSASERRATLAEQQRDVEKYVFPTMGSPGCGYQGNSNLHSVWSQVMGDWLANRNNDPALTQLIRDEMLALHRKNYGTPLLSTSERALLEREPTGPKTLEEAVTRLFYERFDSEDSIA